MKIIELENSQYLKKNYQIGIKCRWDTLEEKICELEDGSVENVKTEAQMGNREK